MNQDTAIYREKARESLAGAHSEFVNRRYNNCANRCYYACFQIAIFALLAAGLQRPGAHWRHVFVRGQFAGELLRRRKLYPAELGETFERCYSLRERADYEYRQVSRTEAERALRRATHFLAVVEGGETL